MIYDFNIPPRSKESVVFGNNLIINHLRLCSNT